MKVYIGRIPLINIILAVILIPPYALIAFVRQLFKFLAEFCENCIDGAELAADCLVKIRDKYLQELKPKREDEENKRR
jgi:hypothetical protein